MQAAHSIITDGMPHIQNKVREVVNDCYDAMQFLEKVTSQLLDDFCKGIIHSDTWDNDKSMPLDFFTLMNVAWFTRIFLMEEFLKVVGAIKIEPKLTDENAVSKAFDNFSELVLKAIEGSETLRMLQEIGDARNA